MRTGKEKPSVKNLDLTHVLRDKKALDAQLNNVLDGHLGDIDITLHRITLEPGAQPFMQRPYRTRPKAKIFMAEEIKLMRKASIIEPVSTKWASPVVILPEYDGSFLVCINYRKIDAVTIPDTNLLVRMDECIGSLDDVTLFSALHFSWRY